MKPRNVTTIYLDFAHGLTHGLQIAKFVTLSEPALNCLKCYVENNRWVEQPSLELREIQHKYLLNHDFEITLAEDFEYGFWLAVYNRSGGRGD